MNILPKKSWHVRNKNNIARVRKDEAAAREEELKKIKQSEIAESQYRLNYLRKNAASNNEKTTSKDDQLANIPKTSDSTQSTELVSSGHVNLFADYRNHVATTNKLHEKEKKEEQEKYEKQIGYLTYLGQDTNEALKLKSWYELAPKRWTDSKDVVINEKDVKSKVNHDPLTLIRALLPKDYPIPKANKLQAQKTEPQGIEDVPKSSECESMSVRSPPKDESASPDFKRHKKKRRHKDHKSDRKHKKKNSKHEKMKRLQEELEAEEVYRAKKVLQLEKLRKERLQREAIERERREILLTPRKSIPDTPSATSTSGPRIVQRYNSQFNPEIAKQNMH